MDPSDARKGDPDAPMSGDDETEIESEIARLAEFEPLDELGSDVKTEEESKQQANAEDQPQIKELSATPGNRDVRVADHCSFYSFWHGGCVHKIVGTLGNITHGIGGVFGCFIGSKADNYCDPHQHQNSGTAGTIQNIGGGLGHAAGAAW